MKLKCYHCQNEIEVAADQLRDDLTCPSCGYGFNSDAAGRRKVSRSWISRWFSGSFSALASALCHAILLVILGLVQYYAVITLSSAEVTPLPPPPDREIEQLPETVALETTEVQSLSDAGATPFQADAGPTIGGAEAGTSTLTDSDFKITAGSDLAVNVDLNPGTGRSTGVSFLGVEARGRYVCIIADCSGSMEGQPLMDLKNQMRQTLDAIGASRKLCKIIFFSDDAIPYAGGKWRNVEVDRSNIDRFVNGIQVVGGTEPLSSLQLVLTASRKPDDIWLMTDGGFTPIHDEIRQLNSRGRPTRIHTIAFNTRDHDELRRIANENQGNYHEY